MAARTMAMHMETDITATPTMATRTTEMHTIGTGITATRTTEILTTAMEMEFETIPITLTMAETLGIGLHSTILFHRVV